LFDNDRYACYDFGSFSCRFSRCCLRWQHFYSVIYSPFLPAPYFHKYGKHQSVKAFVDGITAAVAWALAGAVIVIAIRTIKDFPTATIALVTTVILLKAKKIKEPILF
jgi:adenosine deaminase